MLLVPWLVDVETNSFHWWIFCHKLGNQFCKYHLPRNYQSFHRERNNKSDLCLFDVECGPFNNFLFKKIIIWKKKKKISRSHYLSLQKYLPHTWHSGFSSKIFGGWNSVHVSLCSFIFKRSLNFLKIQQKKKIILTFTSWCWSKCSLCLKTWQQTLHLKSKVNWT